MSNCTQKKRKSLTQSKKSGFRVLTEVTCVFRWYGWKTTQHSTWSKQIWNQLWEFYFLFTVAIWLTITDTRPVMYGLRQCKRANWPEIGYSLLGKGWEALCKKLEPWLDSFWASFCVQEFDRPCKFTSASYYIVLFKINVFHHVHKCVYIAG